jgi:hypothetical protein
MDEDSKITVPLVTSRSNGVLINIHDCDLVKLPDGSFMVSFQVERDSYIAKRLQSGLGLWSIE